MPILANAKLWQVLRAIEAAGESGITTAKLCESLGLTQQQVKAHVYYLRHSNARPIVSRRDFGGGATYRMDGPAFAPIRPEDRVLAILQAAAPSGVWLADLRAAMSRDQQGKAVCALRKAGKIVDKRAWTGGMRYWLTAADRDAELATELATIPPKVAREKARKAGPKQRKKRQAPKRHQVLTIKPAKPVQPIVPFAALPAVTPEHVKPQRAATPLPRFYVDPKDCPKSFAIGAQACSGWVSAYLGSRA